MIILLSTNIQNKMELENVDIYGFGFNDFYCNVVEFSDFQIENKDKINILVMHANMGGFPGMNVPIGFNDEKLPIGLQILGNTCDEAKMYQLASFIEEKLNLDLGGANVENL